jgi:hypothetical protein
MFLEFSLGLELDLVEMDWLAVVRNLCQARLLGYSQGAASILYQFRLFQNSQPSINQDVRMLLTIVDPRKSESLHMAQV